MRIDPRLSKKEVICVKLFDGTKKILGRLAKKKDIKISELAREFVEEGISRRMK